MPQRIGPETPVGDPVLGPTDGDLKPPTIAAGEDGYLAVWEDERQCCDHLIFGARVDSEGNLLDPVGFPISDGGYDSDPTVVWDGSNYLVVWEDWGIQAARVTPEGRVLDERPIKVARERENGGVFSPSAATTGNGSLVAWSECHYVPDRCTVDLFGAVVSPDGGVGERMVLMDGPGGQSASVMAGGPEGYLLSWHTSRDDSYETAFMTLDATGAATSPPVTVPQSRYVHLEYANGAFLVVWSGDVEGEYGIWARRVTPAGQLLDESPILVTWPEQGAALLDVAADPEGGWTVVWSTGRNSKLFASRVAPDGIVANAGSEPLTDHPGEEEDAALAWLGGRATLVWYRPLDRIYSVSAEGLEGLNGAEPVLLSQSSNTQYDAAVAWNGEMFLVVWTDLRGDRKDESIYATRVTPTGQALDGAGMHLVTPGSGWTTPAIASDGEDFLLVWAFAGKGSGRDIYAARVGSEGEVIDDVPLVVSEAPKTKTEPDVVWTGESYLVVWEDYRSNKGTSLGTVTGSGYSEIYGARVSATGELLDPDGILLAGGRKRRTEPDVAVGPSGAAVVWTRECQLNGKGKCSADVLGVSVSADGTPADRLRIGISDAYEATPAVIATSDGFLIAWARATEQGVGIALRGVSSDWSLGPVHRMSPTEKPQDSPQLAWAGDYASLSWTTNGICFDCGGDVAVTRVAADGSPLDPEWTPVATSESYESSLSAASTGIGCTAIIYDRDDAEPGVTRSFLRLFGQC